MRIYFAGSISGGREHAAVYPAIVAALRVHGEILSEHFASQDLTSRGEHALAPRVVHDRDMQWLLAADLVVADVTVPSLGVGYEIGRALEHRKRILCIAQPQEGKRVSSMITGAPALTYREYSSASELPALFAAFFEDNG